MVEVLYCNFGFQISLYGGKKRRKIVPTVRAHLDHTLFHGKC